MRHRVISVDPAPSDKGSTVFDGTKFCQKSATDLYHYLAKPEICAPGTLLCWDAPLTGPRRPEEPGSHHRDFTQRPIDGFFRQKNGCKAPTGISVQPYGQCPHWTISRAILGLPRLGPFDKGYVDLKYHLLPDPDDERGKRPAVVEIHPAVAAWLWCAEYEHELEIKDGAWTYKGKREQRKRREEMWRKILEITSFEWSGEHPDDDDKNTDDNFDAAVGFLLGSLYLEDRDKKPRQQRVILLGSRFTGSFLVPNVKESDLKDKWEVWKGSAQECKKTPKAK